MIAPLTRLSRRTFALAVLAGLALPSLALPAAAHAEAWPSRALRLVVPWPPGGPVDRYSRAIGDALSKELGQPVVVENRSGAGGILGTEHVARSKPDGYTLLGTNKTAFVLNPAATPDIVRYDPVKDFAPLAIFHEGASVIFAHSSLGAKDLDAFIAAARKSGKSLPYASSGTGSAGNIAAKLLSEKYGVAFLPVVYRGGGPRLNALVAGEVKFALFDVPVARDHVKTGTLFPILAAGDRPVPDWPELPTYGDLGLKEFDLVSWHALFLPAGVPDAVRERLRNAVRTAIADPDFRRIGEDGGGRVIFQEGEEAADRIARDFDEQRKIGS